MSLKAFAIENNETSESKYSLIENGDMKNVKKSDEDLVMKQFFACLVGLLLAASSGAAGGFSAVAIPHLKDKIKGFEMTDEEISWFASILNFAYIPTCIIGGVLAQHIGSKRALVFTIPLTLIGFMMQAQAQTKIVLLFGRLLNGIAGGLASGPCSSYIGEISSPKWRTTFGSGMGLFYNFGALGSYSLGSFIHWRLVAASSSIFGLLALITGLFVPESPEWLNSKGYFKEAEDSENWLKGKSKRIFFVFFSDDEPSNRDSETLGSKDEEKSSPGCTSWNPMEWLVRFSHRRDIWRPLSIMLLLGFTQPFCGLVAVSFYAVTLLSSTNIGLDKNLATIIFGITRLIAQGMGSGLLLRFQRRHLFTVSAIITGSGMLMLGFSTPSDTDETSSASTFLSYLPLLGIVVAALGYHIGLSPIMWSYMGEIFPQDVRASMAGLASCIANAGGFLSVKTYLDMVNSETLGFKGTMWFYASVCLCNAFIGWFILPETKGKELAEISSQFAKKQQNKK